MGCKLGFCTKHNTVVYDDCLKCNEERNLKTALKMSQKWWKKQPKLIKEIIIFKVWLKAHRIKMSEIKGVSKLYRG